MNDRGCSSTKNVKMILVIIVSIVYYNSNNNNNNRLHHSNRKYYSHGMAFDTFFDNNTSG